MLETKKMAKLAELPSTIFSTESYWRCGKTAAVFRSALQIPQSVASALELRSKNMQLLLMQCRGFFIEAYASFLDRLQQCRAIDGLILEIQKVSSISMT
jgi:hypothetical protein